MSDEPVPLASVPYAGPALEAPIIYFEGISAAAYQGGMIQLTLEAFVHGTSSPEGKAVTQRVVVAHLRATPASANVLMTALEKLALGVAKPSGSS
jgi:hypothetical protein